MSFLSTNQPITYLSSGSFGLVFITKKENENPSATKILFCDHLDTRTMELIRREAFILKLNHENLIKVLSTSEESFTKKDIQQLRSLLPKFGDPNCIRFPKWWYQSSEIDRVSVFILKMELCGPTLRHWLNHHASNRTHFRALPEFQANQRLIISGMANGMAFLHKNRIIHRDFKPENVLFSLSQDSTEVYKLPIKIGDFGLSREIPTENTSYSRVSMTNGVGTECYRAPEISFGKYSAAADIYSFGLVMWEVLQLIDDLDRPDYFNRLVNNNEDHLILKSLSLPDAKYLILRMTTTKVGHRMNSLQPFIDGKVRFAHNSQDLVACLKNATEGEVIYLGVGKCNYEGSFELEKDRLTLIGMGDATCLRPTSRNKVEAVSRNLVLFPEPPPHDMNENNFILSIRGSHCSVKEMHIENVHHNQNGIAIFGNGNKFSKISLSTGDNGAINVFGDENSVSWIKIKNSQYGIAVSGRDNKLHDNYIQDVGEGISLGGLRNVVTTLCWEKLQIGIHLLDGSRSNRLLNIDEIGKSDGCVGLMIERDTSLCSITDVKCEKVIVGGFFHKFDNVKASVTMSISGGGHHFTDCEGLPVGNYDYGDYMEDIATPAAGRRRSMSF